MVGETINTMRKSEESLTDRDKLINSMQLPSNIRSLSKEEQNEVIHPMLKSQFINLLKSSLEKLT